MVEMQEFKLLLVNKLPPTKKKSTLLLFALLIIADKLSLFCLSGSINIAKSFLPSFLDCKICVYISIILFANIH